MSNIISKLQENAKLIGMEIEDVSCNEDLIRFNINPKSAQRFSMERTYEGTVKDFYLDLYSTLYPCFKDFSESVKFDWVDEICNLYGEIEIPMPGKTLVYEGILPYVIYLCEDHLKNAAGLQEPILPNVTLFENFSDLLLYSR